MFNLNSSLLFFVLLNFIAIVLCDDPYYVVIPKLENDKATNDKINDKILSKVGDASKVFHSKSRNDEIGTLYWYAALSDDNKKYFSDQKEIRIVEDISIASGESTSRIKRMKGNSTNGDFPVTKYHRIAKRDIISQTGNVPDQLKLVCQAKGQKLSDLDGYYYDESAGSNVRIYIIDSGVRITHKEFKSHKIDWMFAGPFPVKDKTDADTNGHGTSMASVALGAQDGVTKAADITMVRADITTDDLNKRAPLTWLDGLVQVYDDVKENNYKGKAVLSMSWGWYLPSDGSSQRSKDLASALQDLYIKVLKPLIQDLDIPAFVSAGNHNFPYPTPVNTVPAILGENELIDLIVVGGVDNNGAKLDSVQDAPYVGIYAPADEVETADPGNDDDYMRIDGTSPATAMVAGLTAYFMGQGISGSDARKRLLDTAYPRKDNNKNFPKVLYNGVDTRKDTSTSDQPASQNVDSGILQCQPQHDDGDSKYYFNREGALAAIGSICTTWGTSPTDEGQDYSGHTHDGHGTDLEIAIEEHGCGPFDFGSDDDLNHGINTCIERFTNVIELCDTKKRTSDAWKQGGIFFRDCLTWKLTTA